jgi:hypothetical protein
MDGVDLGEQRRQLTEAYQDKWDEELRTLAAEFSDLTEMAQQVLRDEMRKRGLGDPQAKQAPTPVAAIKPELRWQDGETHEEDASEASVEFTWKTPLCDCATREEAWQRGEMLRRAGIESWIEAPGSYDFVVAGPRVVVAADQLDEARAIIAQPVPQEIIDQSKDELAETVPFESPVCPGCGTPDPVLVGVDPVNSWQCESCGREWTDSA